MTYSRLRDWVLSACAQPNARPVLYAISLSESIFFPIPTEVGMVPVIAQQPHHWWRIVLWCVFFSVCGALLAYSLTWYVADDLLNNWVSDQTADQIRSLATQLNQDGFVLVLISAVTPIPFKLCALAAGMTALSLTTFISAAFLGRLARYALVGYLVYMFRDRWQEWAGQYFEPVSWLLVVGLVAYLIFSYV